MSQQRKIKVTGRDFTRGLVRERDNNICQSCGKVWHRGMRKFDVHHLNGICGKQSRAYDKVSSIDGLITYCHKCHLGLHEVREKMKQSQRARIGLVGDLYDYRTSFIRRMLIEQIPQIKIAKICGLSKQRISQIVNSISG